MLASVTRHYKDLSTPEAFRFAFYCDNCGWEWQSKAYAFCLKGFKPPVDKRIRVMLWNQQYQEAYESANREALARFNRCAAGGCRICDDCFNSAELSAEYGSNSS